MQYCGLDGHGSGDADLEDARDPVREQMAGPADFPGGTLWGKSTTPLQCSGAGSSTGCSAAHGRAKDKEGESMLRAWKRGSRAEL